MSASLKGGLFVGAAVAVGLLAAFLVPPLVVGREAAKGPRTKATLPVMPDVVGQPLDEAEQELGRRRIAYVTDGGEVFGIVIPSIWQVCETVPGGGAKVHGTAHVRAAPPSICGI
jgi:hypothetical protein